MKVTRNSFSLGTIEVSRNSRGKMQVHQNMYPYTLNSIVYSMVKNISICPKRNFYPFCKYEETNLTYRRRNSRSVVGNRP